MNHGSLFSGIGGFDLAAQWMGWTNVFHCEYNPFGQRVLKHYWPNAISYGDIKQTDFTIHRGEIDVLSGGFPCQPFSSAGKRKGTEDDRHLWPEMLRAIREIQPAYVVGENVRGFTNWNGGLVFDQVQADLEAEGYEVLPFLLPACAVNAPHRRDRIWIVAHRTELGRGRGGSEEVSGERENHIREGLGNDKGFGKSGTIAHAKDNGDRGELRGLEGENGSKREPKEHRQDNAKSWDDGKERTTADTGGKGSQGRKVNGSTRTIGEKSHKHSPRFIRPTWQDFPTQPPVCQRNDGLPSGLDGITVSRHRKESIMAYGNAIVPQVAFEIFKTIERIEQ